MPLGVLFGRHCRISPAVLCVTAVFVASLGGCESKSRPAAAGAVPPEAPATIRADVQRIGEATVSGDIATVADMTHPEIVRMMGGRDRMIEQTRNSMQTIAAQGFRLTGMEVGEPGPITESGGSYFCLVPIVTRAATPQGTMRMDGQTLAVSGDGGQSWKYVNVDAEKYPALRKAIPSLPPDLPLLPNQPPRPE